jgi:spore photoproduct lyase
MISLESFSKVNYKWEARCGVRVKDMPVVKKKIFETLDGARKELVHQVGDGSIIKRFEKTPPPKRPTDVVCPHFLELKWANGCYFDCAWCYLQGTYRFHPEWKNGNPNIKNFTLIESHLKAFISKNGTRPEILNSGELSDSLLAEKGEAPFSRFIVEVLDKYDKEKKHKVLFLTKSTNVKNILDIKRPDRLIMSFTLNAYPVAKRWERAPTVEARIKAAKKVYDAGYITRVRIDPMVPIENWDKHYSVLADAIFSNFIPDRITIGSLRGLSTTIRNAKDKSWTVYLSEKSNWGMKIDFKTRYRMYSTLINYLREKHGFANVALCKETKEMWEKLGLNHRGIKCNCIW